MFEEQDMHCLKGSAHRLLTNDKRKIGNIAVKKPGQLHLNQVAKMSFTINGARQHEVCPYGRWHTEEDTLPLLHLSCQKFIS